MLQHHYETIQLAQPLPQVFLITLNRPAVRNAINSVMMQELKYFWEQCCVEAAALRCIIITGAPPAFCAGADLKERMDIDLLTWHKQHAVFEQAMLAMLDCPVPVLAAANGSAFGGGLELALASDFIYASDTALFSQSEVKVGLSPGALGTQNLPRACGLRRAKELAFTGAIFSAQDAYNWGIVNQLFPPDQLLDAALKTAETIAANAPVAVRQTKKAMNMSQHLDLKTGFNYEIEVYNRLLMTEDRQEGLAAFNEKRRAQFKGK